MVIAHFFGWLYFNANWSKPVFDSASSRAAGMYLEAMFLTSGQQRRPYLLVSVLNNASYLLRLQLAIREMYPLAQLLRIKSMGYRGLSKEHNRRNRFPTFRCEFCFVGI